MRYLLVLLLIVGCSTYHGPSIEIASFNIQVFGIAKRENPAVMDMLTDIACQYDILAVQELRDKTETTAGIFVEQINQKCQNREYIISPRLGRSSSKENYAVIYNNATVDVMAHYVWDDKVDAFEREPMIVSIRSGKLNLTILNIHIKPGDAESELEALRGMVSEIDNVMVLGDLNADCRYMDGIPDYKDFIWLIGDDKDTTVGRSNCAYDRIGLTDDLQKRVIGTGVDRFDIGISSELAAAVSDHYPVYAIIATGEI